MRRIAVLLVLVLSGVGTAFGQATTSVINGHVMDPQGLALPGAIVTVTGTQGEKRFTADAEGHFTAPFLTPGKYAVRAELTGFGTVEQKDITVGLGQSVDVPLTLGVGGVMEMVQVVGTVNVIDVRHSTAGATILSEMLQRVPVGRDIGSTLYLAPGVSSSGSAGNANPSIAGGSGLDNQYVIDGVNITSQGYGALGSYSMFFGSLGNAIPFEFIEEVQVKTGGYEAEYGQSTGGLVNVITKSGSNIVKGSAFAYSRPDALESKWTQYQTVNGSVQTVGSRMYDGGIEAGFPVAKNHVFFFGAIDPGRDIRTIHAPEGFPLERLGDVDRVRHTLAYLTKGTWQIASPHRIDVSVFGDPSKGEDGPQRLSSLLGTDTGSFSSLNYGGHNQTVRYNGMIGSRWLIEGSFARASNRLMEIPSVDAWHVIDTTVTPNAVTGGVGLFEADKRSLDYQYAAKSTHVLGDHQIKYGLAYDDVTYRQLNGRSGPTFIAPDGRHTTSGADVVVIADPSFGKIYRVTRANFTGGPTTTQQYASFFVQDSWQATNRLTVNPGLRYEQETLSGREVSDFTLKNNWGPHVAASFDLTGDAKTSLYASYGRSFARIPNDLAARGLSADESTSRADYFDAGLTRPIPNGVLAGGVTRHFQLQGGGADTIDPNAKLSYTNEYLFGVERQVASSTSVSVRYTYKNIGRVLEDVSNAPMLAYDLGLRGLSSVYILTNPNSSTPILPSAEFLGARFDDPVHRYRAVEITMNRRFAGSWSMLASYRWSRLRGNFEGFYRDDNGQADPGITSLYDFPTNDPSYAAIGGPLLDYRGDIRFLGDPDGILPLDRPQQVKVFGNYLFPKGLGFGFSIDASPGAPLTPLAASPNYATGGEIPEAPRGSGIQTVDGFKTRAPFQRLMSVQASYVVKLGGSRNITLVADVFNLFNTHTVLMYDQWTQLTGPSPNDDFGKPVTQVLRGAPPQFQAPRQIRLGARFLF